MKFDYKGHYEVVENSQNLIATRFGFLTGRSATGKSTLGRALMKKGFGFIEIDDLMINDINKKFNLTQKESINISKGLAPLEVEDYAIKKINAEMDKFPTDQKVLIEGTMASLRVLERIFEKYNGDFTVIFLYPDDRNKYQKRVRERLIRDIENNTQTLPIWNSIPQSIVDSYINEGQTSKEFNEYIHKLTNAMYDGSFERHKIFADSGLRLITVSV